MPRVIVPTTDDMRGRESVYLLILICFQVRLSESVLSTNEGVATKRAEEVIMLSILIPPPGG